MGRKKDVRAVYRPLPIFTVRGVSQMQGAETAGKCKKPKKDRRKNDGE